MKNNVTPISRIVPRRAREVLNNAANDRGNAPAHSTVRIEGVDGEIRWEVLAGLLAHIDENPHESLAIIRSWLGTADVKKGE
ncbi:MAG: hypothetical protein ABF791_03720 [Acetobacter sp.]|uniref:hypothetical protein n=1 Tax=Acetobacter sp. TaxID=440 RepID=UPI0039EC3B11